MITDGDGGQGEDDGEDPSSPEEITILNQESHDGIPPPNSGVVDFGSRL
jgi:hypothetical protein